MQGMEGPLLCGVRRRGKEQRRAADSTDQADGALLRHDEADDDRAGDMSGSSDRRINRLRTSENKRGEICGGQHAKKVARRVLILVQKSRRGCAPLGNKCPFAGDVSLRNGIDDACTGLVVMRAALRTGRSHGPFARGGKGFLGVGEVNKRVDGVPIEYGRD